MKRYYIVEPSFLVKKMILLMFVVTANKMVGMEARHVDVVPVDVVHEGMFGGQARPGQHPPVAFRAQQQAPKKIALTETQQADYNSSNSMAQGISDFGRYLGIKPQGIFLSSDPGILANRERDLRIDQPILPVDQQVVARRQAQQGNLNYVGQAFSYTGDALGLKSRGWFLPKDELVAMPVHEAQGNPLHNVAGVRDLPEVQVVADHEIDQLINDAMPMPDDINFNAEQQHPEHLNHEMPEGFDPNNPQHYNNYYGVSFGPTFFKMYESTPEFLKSWSKFGQSANDFFSACSIRFNHLTSAHGGYEGSWTAAAKNAWKRFIEICTKKFDDEGRIVQAQQEGIGLGVGGLADHNYDFALDAHEDLDRL